LVCHSENLVEIFLRDDPECFATADEHFFQTVRPAPGVPFKQDAAFGDLVDPQIAATAFSGSGIQIVDGGFIDLQIRGATLRKS
jgi:hypothetical protein